MNSTKKRSVVGALLTTLTLGLLGMVPAIARADDAQTYCAGYGDTTAITLCQIKYNARYAAWISLPPNLTGDAQVADGQAWTAATSTNTSVAYSAYTAGWQAGVSRMDDGIANERYSIDVLCATLIDPSWIPGCIADAKWWVGVYTDARPTAVANAQVASNRAADVYATFTPRSDGVDVVFKSTDATIVDGSNGIVNGKAQVTISVDGTQFTWMDGVGGFTVFVTPPQPTTTPTTSPTTPTPTSKIFTKTYAPTVSGTVKVGKVLTAKVKKAWSPKATYAYQWLRNGTAITGATKSKYKLTGTDYKAKISVKVTGTRSGYTATIKVSKSTKSVKIGIMSKGKVKITGTAKVGNILTAKTYSRWSSSVVFTHQWYRNGKKISGATAKTYAPTALDRGKKIKVKAVATKPGYKAVSKTSKSTGKVKAGTAVTPAPTPTPSPVQPTSPSPSPSPSPSAPVSPTPTALPTP